MVFMIEQTDKLADEGYIIHINNFDGPLDLLWELIKKSKIDITDISISLITEQYLDYLKYMNQLNVKIAIEFIWMATELLYYKSKALLPSGDIEDEYFVPPLPPELIEKLLEFKKYQLTSIQLNKFYENSDNCFVRNNDLDDFFSNDDYIDASLYDLLKAFAEVIESERIVIQEEIVFDEILISDRIEYIMDLLKDNEIIIFSDIFSTQPARSEVVVSFLAILEMTKTSVIKIIQHRVFGEIRIARNFNINGASENY